jgi:hypothetical protein
MKALSPPLIFSLSLLAACAGHVEVDASGSSSSAAASSGAASSTGATSTSSSSSSSSSGAVDAGPDCTALVAELTAKITEARACTSAGTWDECDQSVSVADECGCHAPLNHVNVTEIAAAQAALAAVLDAGCATTCSPSPCVARYNDPSYHGGCVQTKAPPGSGLCMWVGGD